MFAATSSVPHGFRQPFFLSALAAVALAFLALGRPVHAEVGVLVLADGSRQMGNVTVTAQGYSVLTKNEGVKTFDKAKVKDFLRLPQLRRDLEEQKAKADLKQPLALLTLATWALDNGLCDEAEQLAQDILKIEPDHASAKRVLGWAADLRSKLSGQPPAGTPPPAAAQATGAPAVPAAEGPASQPTSALVRQPLPLTKDDIEKIRIREIKFKLDKPVEVKVSFKNDVLERFYKSMEGAEYFRTAADRANFFKQKPARQLQILLQCSDAAALSKWEKDIDIETDPPPLMTFRNSVYKYITENCATATCHGRDNSPGFSWITAAAPGPGQYLANFLELEAHSYGPAQAKLVNRDKPNESLLLLYSLPQNQTQYKHPNVRGWPVRRLDDKSPGYRDVLNWITDELSFPPAPDYGVVLKRQGESPNPAPENPPK